MFRMMTGAVLVAVMSVSMAMAADEAKTEKTEGDGWVSLFDGKTLAGWKANENDEGFIVEDGAIKVGGPRNHLFYVGTDEQPYKPFKNFIFECDLMTRPNANSGLYIHTQFQPEGWPHHGYEIQINNSHSDLKRSTSIYDVQNVMNDSPAKDNEWYKMTVIVQDRCIVIKVNGKIVNAYTEPVGKEPGKDFTRILTEGTFAFQAHDPGSVAFVKNIRVKRLP